MSNMIAKTVPVIILFYSQQYISFDSDAAGFAEIKVLTAIDRLSDEYFLGTLVTTHNDIFEFSGVKRVTVSVKGVEKKLLPKGFNPPPSLIDSVNYISYMIGWDDRKVEASPSPFRKPKAQAPPVKWKIINKGKLVIT